MATVSVRYIVHDVDDAIAFYCERLGFHEEMHPAPTFAMLSVVTFGWCSAHRAEVPVAARPWPTARCRNPVAGTVSRSRSTTSPGWSTRCAAQGVHFRNDIVNGVGGKQILLDDPSGNPIELFEPTLPEAALDRSD